MRPLKIQDPRIENHIQLCEAVASIPFKSHDVPTSEVTKHLNFVHRHRQLNHGFDALPSSFVAAWKVKANPAELVSENFHVQFSSPSTMMGRREGTLMEHAMALCSMLLGLGANAYVAIGNIRKRTFIWVVVIYPKTEQDKVVKRSRYADTGDDEDQVLSDFDFYTYKGTRYNETFYKQDFERLDLVNEVKAKNDELIISHYDVVSGMVLLVTLSSRKYFQKIIANAIRKCVSKTTRC